MSAYNLVFWQNIPSPHQVAVLRSLAAIGHTVTLIADMMELPERRAMGWRIPDLTGVNLIESRQVDARQYIADQNPATVNISSGIRGCLTGPLVTAECARQNRRLGFIAEPGDPRGIKGLLRKWVYKFDALQYRKSVDFILAMGQTGVNWYTASGYPKSKVFPYCYVVDDIQTGVMEPKPGPFRICFIGSLVHLKRVDLLINSLQSMQDGVCTLAIVGDGPKKNKLLQLSKKLRVDSRIEWIGYQPHSVALDYLQNCDLLILPSEYDGWGAVVNEALMLGVPVICSNSCGASDLINNNHIGRVFRSNSIESLNRSINELISQGKLDTISRNYIKKWSGCITGHSIARYLVFILDHVYNGAQKPIAPWRITN